MDFIRAFYEEQIKKYGKGDIRAMGWHDEEEYSIRFDVAVRIADLNNCSILDVGCGFGGLHRYLISSNVKNFTYLGVDIVPKMIEIAKQNNQMGRFIVADILKDKLPSFDYVFCIGTLNVENGADDYFMKMLKTMIEIAKKGVSINFLSGLEHLKRDLYHIENVDKLTEKIKNDFPDVSIKIIEDERLIAETFMFIYKK